MVWLYLVQVNHAFSSRPASSSSLSKQDCIVSGIISTRGPGSTTIIRIRLPLFDSSTKGSTRTQSYVSQSADAMLILRSALSSCSEEGGDLTSPSYMPGGFKLCGFHGKTVDCTHTGTAVWNAERAGAERLQQTTLPSQAATEEHRKYCSSIFLYQVLMNRPCHQQSDVSVLIFRPYLRWWWQGWPCRPTDRKSESGIGQPCKSENDGIFCKVIVQYVLLYHLSASWTVKALLETSNQLCSLLLRMSGNIRLLTSHQTKAHPASMSSKSWPGYS